MDLDGLQNNSGLYTLTPVAAQTSIGKENVIQWRTAQGELKGKLRVGFMSQVSPDGRYVVTTLNPADLDAARRRAAPATTTWPISRTTGSCRSSIPTRGILSWYSRETGMLQPLPGADDRAVRADQRRLESRWQVPGLRPRRSAWTRTRQARRWREFANDPDERQIQYDLYRIPFNGGRGGTPEPIAGARETA